MSGAKLVIGILGALAALTAVVVLAFVLFEPEGAPCATGELATNRIEDGQYVSRTETFASVEEAEAFICRDVPELYAEGWTLERVAALRTVPIEVLVEGSGLAIVTLEYVNSALDRSLTLDTMPFFTTASYFESELPADRGSEEVRIQGNPATAYRFGINPDQVTVIWRDGSLEHRAVAQTGESFTLDDMIGVLETLE